MEATAGVLDQVGDEVVQHALERLVEFELVADAAEFPLNLAEVAVEDCDPAANVFEFEQVRFVAIVKVGGVVGDLVGMVDELGFERRPLIEQIFGQLGILGGRVVVRVLDDAFANLEGEVQSGMRGITLLKVFDDAQCVKIVVEALAVLAHRQVQGALAGMSEGGMADVMHQGEGFDEAFIQAERGGDGARNLRDLDGVGEPGAEMIREALGEDLGLILQTAEGAGMNHAVAVALEVVTIGMRRLWIAASERGLNPHSVGGQHGGSVAPGTAPRSRMWQAPAAAVQAGCNFDEAFAGSQAAGSLVRRLDVWVLTAYFARVFFLPGELHLRSIEFLLDLGYVGGFNLGRNRFLPLLE